MDIRKIVIECVALVLNVHIEDADQVTGEEDLREFGLSSFNFMQVVVTLEREFGFRFDPDELLIENIDTVNKITDFIQQRIEAKQADRA